MNTLDELKTAIAQATGAKSVEFSPSGRVADLILRDGSAVSTMVNERETASFNQNILTFSNEYFESAKSVNGEDGKKGMIIIYDMSNFNRVLVIDLFSPSKCGFDYLTSVDEWGGIWHHYLKTCG